MALSFYQLILGSQQQDYMARSINAKSIVGGLLLLVLSGTFIFSAITKFMSIEPFEWTFMDMGFSNALAYGFARFFIGFEFCLAFLLLAHIYLKRISYPLTLLFLMVMTLYLIIILVTKGNKVDCGCFGDTLPMSPLQSILKNIVLIGITVVLSKIYSVKPYRFQKTIALIASCGLIAIPYIFVPFAQSPTPINLNALYADPHNHPQVELRQGKHLVALMSLGCPHCRNAAKIFSTIYAEDSTVPIFMVLYGAAIDTNDFFQETKANKVPHFVFSNAEAFIAMAGKYVPSISWINNSVKERKISYVQLNTALIKNWKNNN